MNHNPKAVQQWARSVVTHDYWNSVESSLRAEFVNELLFSLEKGDSEMRLLNETKLLVLSDVFQSLRAFGVDTDYVRDYDESVVDDAE